MLGDGVGDAWERRVDAVVGKRCEELNENSPDVTNKAGMSLLLLSVVVIGVLDGEHGIRYISVSAVYAVLGRD